MSASEILQNIGRALKDGEGRRCALILCPDRTRRERIIEKLLEVSSLKSVVETVNCDGLEENELISRCADLENVNLFAPQRLLLLRNVESLKTALHRVVLKAIENLPPHARIVLSCSDLLQTSVLYKSFSSWHALIALTELKGPELERWIAKELKVMGIKSVDNHAISLIRRSSEDSVDEAYATIQKLSLYLEGSTVTCADVEALISWRAPVDEFQFISAIASERRGALSLMTHTLFNQGVSPFPLLALIHRNMVNYTFIHKDSAHSPRGSCDPISIQPWLQKKLLPLAQRYTLDQLIHSFIYIARADGLLKNHSLGADAVFDEVIEGLTP